MVQATDKAILDNLDFEIATWRERQIEVFNELPFPEIKGDDKGFFEAVGWLNFAMDFTETVFPHTSPKTVITEFTKPYAIPLWIAGQAQEKFASYYRKLRDDAQQRLNATLRSVRDEFTNAIVDQARGFKATTHARNLASGILTYLNGRQFQDDAQMDAYIRRLVHNAHLVETRLEELRRRTQPGFRRLMDKISHVWQTTYHVSRWHRLHLWIRGSRSERYKSLNWNSTKKESELAAQCLLGLRRRARRGPRSGDRARHGHEPSFNDLQRDIPPVDRSGSGRCAPPRRKRDVPGRRQSRGR